MRQTDPTRTEFDTYLAVLLTQLCKKYTNLSVNRGSKTLTFFYSDAEGDHQFTINKDYAIECFNKAEMPKEIAFLLERADIGEG
jgi:hypothetical protein